MVTLSTVPILFILIILTLQFAKQLLQCINGTFCKYEYSMSFGQCQKIIMLNVKKVITLSLTEVIWKNLDTCLTLEIRCGSLTRSCPLARSIESEWDFKGTSNQRCFVIFQITV